MTRRGSVVVLGFDSCDVGIVRRLARAGRLPTFGRLLQEWSWARVRNPHGFFVQTLWPSFFTGRAVGRLGFHCWETISLAYERRLSSPLEIRGRPFWHTLAEAGRAVAVLDMPHSRAADGDDLLEVSEYAAHDRHFGLRTSPGALRDDIVSRFGFHPVFSLDPYARRTFAGDDYVHRAGALRTPEEEACLLQDLNDGVRRKLALSAWVYGQRPWDLFVSVFGESHAVGHQLWHVHDPGHPRHSAATAARIGDPIEAVYAAQDRALADLLAGLRPDASVFVLLSHGMRAHYDGTAVLEPALARLDAFHRRGSRGGIPIRLAKAGWERLGDVSGARLTPLLLRALRRRLRRNPPVPLVEFDIGPVVRSRQRYFMSPNNTVHGGIRINLAGREPRGLVAPGAEFDAVCAELRSDLMSLINVTTGEPVVRAVVRTDAWHERDPIDELPDLLVHWNRRAPIETVWSPRTGIIHAPYGHWRTGDHRPGGVLLVKGPRVPVRADLGLIENRDLGPTIASMLGVELPAVDGRPIRGLLGG